MSNMDDIFRTFHTLQKGMEPLQALMPMIEQTKKVVEPLQPVLEQVRQVKELSAIASNPFSINNDLSYILKLSQHRLKKYVSCRKVCWIMILYLPQVIMCKN